jgi:CheY-like chemotaxis protein
LSKPYSSDDLAWKVRSMLSEVKTPGRNTTDGLRILVVEDEALILMSTVDMLTDMGHTVQQAMTIAQARALIASEPLDLVILDIGLPDGSGLDFAKELLQQFSKLKLLVASGSQVEPSKGMGVIGKPYSEADLAPAIARLFGPQD